MNKGNITRDDFDHWIFSMGDDLEEFLSSTYFDSEQLSNLNYSIDSLTVIEQWILDRFNSTEEVIRNENADLVDKAVKYIGETFRKQLGGNWDIDLENQKNAYYNLPVLTNYSEKATPICPHTLVSAAADRRSGKFLKTILQNAIARKEK